MLRELPDKNPKRVHAAFLYHPLEFGFAATTRTDSDLIGIPGGKVDPGESPRQACLRECKEEGWAPVQLDYEPFFEGLVEGRLVYWYAAVSAVRLSVYKEQERLRNVIATYDQLIASPYRFRDATRAYIASGIVSPHFNYNAYS